MINRKDLKVGLVTTKEQVVKYFDNTEVCYHTDRHGLEVVTIDSFCRKYSIKKEKIEVVRWVNVYPDGYSSNHLTKEEAERYAETHAIAVAVKLVGSYEV